MKRFTFVFLASVLGAIVQPSWSQAPAPQRPLFETKKVDGTDNVYVFRHGNYQAMFVVTPAGVIATDPISYGRPEAAVSYVEEIRKITDKPIKYLINPRIPAGSLRGGQGGCARGQVLGYGGEGSETAGLCELAEL